MKETLNKIVNVTILENPVNWLVIFTVVVLSAYSVYTVYNASKGYLNIAPAN